MSAPSQAKVVVPPGLMRNHPSQTGVMDPDDAAAHLLAEMAHKAGKDLATADVLDIGCGTRFAVGILNKPIPIGSYTGVDVYGQLVDWLRLNVADPRQQFIHWPVRNPEYNPGGKPMEAFPGFPTERTFDIVCFFSVFTHLDPADARTMLRFSLPRLRPDGRVFLTAFIADDVEGYVEGQPDRPSLMSRYGRSLFEGILAEAGFAIVAVHPRVQLMAPQYVLAPR